MNPDLPPAELQDKATIEEMEWMARTATLATYYRQQLRDAGIPEDVAASFLVDWHYGKLDELGVEDVGVEDE